MSVGVLEPGLKTNSTSDYLPDMPYRGLEPFRYVDKSIFFARTKEARRLLRYVTMYRGVLFYGDSGAGKSSLINAGLIPELIEEGFTPDRIRLQPEKDNELIIERIPLTANGKPPYLPSNFAGDDESESAKARVVLPVRNLKRSLQNLSANKLPLLIFDQFEEIITLFEEARVGKNLEESLELQNSIINVLVDLIGDQTLKVKLLFVFREDYLAKLTKFLARCPDLTDQFLRLIPPITENLDAIIRNPFKNFPGKFGNEFSDELIGNLEKQLRQRSEATTLNLSEVEVVCLKLWQSNAPVSLLEKRGVEGLLEDFLNESLNNLPKDLYETSIALLRKMVTSSGTRNVVSEDDLIVSVKKEGFPEDEVKKCLNALTNQTKLVRRERRHDTFFYQIVSEFLVPWIRRKQQEQKAQMARRKYFKYAALGSGIVLLIAGVLFAMGYYRQFVLTKEAVTTRLVREAEENAELKVLEAEKAQKRAEEETNLISSKYEEIQAENSNLHHETETLSAAIKSDTAKAQTQISTLTTQLQQEKDKTQTAEAAAAKWESELKNLNNDLKNLNKKYSDLANMYDSAHSNEEYAKREIAKLKLEIAELKKKK